MRRRPMTVVLEGRLGVVSGLDRAHAQVVLDEALTEAELADSGSCLLEDLRGVPEVFEAEVMERVPEL